MTTLPVNVKTENHHTTLMPQPAKKINQATETLEPTEIVNPTETVKPSDSIFNEEDVQKAVTKLNQYVQSIKRELNFSIEKETGRTIVKVIDSTTNEVIRQLPSEAAIEIAKQVKTTQNLGFKGTA